MSSKTLTRGDLREPAPARAASPISPRPRPAGPPRPREADAAVFRATLRLFYVVSCAVVLGLFLEGRSFYFTPAGERAHHDGYWQWKSGGGTGHMLGVVGASMMVLMQLYSVRKRVPALRGLGPLNRWLDVHIYLGVFGPLLVILHSAFKVQGLVALSFWSMIAVALSGVAGRYLYMQIPRTRAGEELTLAELEAADQRLTDRLRREFGLEQARLDRLESLAAPSDTGRGLAGSLAALLFGRARRRRALRALTRGVRSAPARVLRELEQVILQKALTRQRLALWVRVHELFHYWNVVHKPFAVVMYLFMVIHIGVAVFSGYGWVRGF